MLENRQKQDPHETFSVTVRVVTSPGALAILSNPNQYDCAREYLQHMIELASEPPASDVGVLLRGGPERTVGILGGDNWVGPAKQHATTEKKWRWFTGPACCRLKVSGQWHHDETGSRTFTVSIVERDELNGALSPSHRPELVKTFVPLYIV